MYMPKNVLYLRRKNFSYDGKLNVYGLEKKIVIVFIHGNFCGFCHKAAPDFIKAANSFENDVSVAFAAIQIDGDVPGERETKEILPYILNEYVGVPDYAFFYNGSPLFEHLDDRRADSIISKIKMLKLKYIN